jgi:hypothetical protein
VNCAGAIADLPADASIVLRAAIFRWATLSVRAGELHACCLQQFRAARLSMSEPETVGRAANSKSELAGATNSLRTAGVSCVEQIRARRL